MDYFHAGYYPCVLHPVRLDIPVFRSPDESVVNDWILLLRKKLEEWNILF